MALRHEIEAFREHGNPRTRERFHRFQGFLEGSKAREQLTEVQTEIWKRGEIKEGISGIALVWFFPAAEYAGNTAYHLELGEYPVKLFYRSQARTELAVTRRTHRRSDGRLDTEYDCISVDRDTKLTDYQYHEPHFCPNDWREQTFRGSYIDNGRCFDPTLLPSSELPAALRRVIINICAEDANQRNTPEWLASESLLELNRYQTESILFDTKEECLAIALRRAREASTAARQQRKGPLGLFR